MDLEIIILSEESQKEKDKYHTVLLICGILKKKKKRKGIGIYVTLPQGKDLFVTYPLPVPDFTSKNL